MTSDPFDRDFFIDEEERDEFGGDPWGELEWWDEVLPTEDKPEIKLAKSVLAMKEKKMKFYVTFGQSSAARNGYWVVRADDELEAREKTNKQFGKNWSMMYSEQDFDSSFFPAGELGELK